MAVRTIQQLRTAAQQIKNATTTGFNTANRVGSMVEDITDTMEHLTSQSSGGSGKWESFQARLLKCKMFQPFDVPMVKPHPPYSDTNQFGGISISGLLSPSLKNDYSKTQHYNIALYANYFGFPADENPANYGFAFYYESNRAFKGNASHAQGLNNENRFARGTTGTFQPPSRYSSVGDWSYHFKKLVAIGLGGTGWAKLNEINSGLKPCRLSTLTQKTYGQIAHIQHSFQISQSGKTIGLYINGKKYAQRSLRVKQWDTKRINAGINIRFQIPFEIRLIKDIGNYRKQDIKTMYKGYIVAGCTVYGNGNPSIVTHASHGYSDVI